MMNKYYVHTLMILSPAIMPALAADPFSVVPVTLTGLASANVNPNPSVSLFTITVRSFHIRPNVCMHLH